MSQTITVLEEFEAHAARLKQRSRSARENALLTSTALEEEPEKEEDDVFAPLATDDWRGDAHLRTLRTYLKRVDATHKRSDNQRKFHDAFERACARVLFGTDWQTHKPAIMTKYGFASCPSEVMISTPRYAPCASFPCISLQHF